MIASHVLTFFTITGMTCLLFSLQEKEKNDSFKTMYKFFKLFHNKICFVLFFFKAEYSLGWEDAICLQRCPQCPSPF